MNQKNLLIYRNICLFYIALHLPLIILLKFSPQLDATNEFWVTVRFYTLFMVFMGNNLFSFILGIYLQKKHQTQWQQIFISVLVVFLINMIVLTPLWQPDFLRFDLNAQHLFKQSFNQTLCFFAGAALVRWIQNLMFNRANNL